MRSLSRIGKRCGRLWGPIVFDGTGRLLKPGLHEVARVQPRQGAGLVFFKPYPTELSPASLLPA